MLASGSSGNCTYVASDRTAVLIDAGLSVRETARRLTAAGLALECVNAILVTHEHSDHVSGLVRLARKLRLPVYVTERTGQSIDWEGSEAKVERFQAGSTFSVGDLEVDSFTIPHDAIDPVGFSIRVQGVKFSVATDLGYVTDSIRFHLAGANLLLLESNHDLEMLKVGPYPWPVKQRVMSRVGHLSNDHACDFIRNDFDSRAGILVLGHLSDQNNHPEIVRLMAHQALAARGLSTRLVVATQKQATEVFTL
ncbi:MAG: MBL fold metallo-hydrolase [Bryobacteraceae bacterium]